MPTATDEKLAEKVEGLARNLADFRVEVAERFEKVTERFGVLGKAVEGFRAAVETELMIIRRLGTWLLGGVFGLIAALITGATSIGWSASAVVAEVKQQSQRLDRIESQAYRGPDQPARAESPRLIRRYKAPLIAELVTSRPACRKPEVDPKVQGWWRVERAPRTAVVDPDAIGPGGRGSCRVWSERRGRR